MSNSFTPAPERESHLLAVGQQCSDSLCRLVDFLPFKCQHCDQPFCAEHFLPNQHKCKKYDESQHDRIAPSCPLCNTPVAIPPGQDPNVRMERHINTECSVTTGKTTKSSAPHCARAKCGKVLFSPIRCDTCKQQYCPQHRFPKDHICTGITSAATKPNASVAQSTSAAGAAALAAFKRATNTTTKSSVHPPPLADRPKPASAKQTSQPGKTLISNKPSTHNPLSKTDR
ncbi:hypothetical protein PHLGIDRAFT_74650 [Phlebiopsis gigantea 11061_1 CR5-6]|uniref:AN1-type domain-containing protein n=1 Tax=Phlebiopsis gigantea (strain 11061_1 CR5-6) TaxID=745531 RepID=A0A0C3RVB5_PHLG1|nr:hypothetical protein PHLGIDRAFT_74650 [Phlebiopsis gigantea 11061_1 CR5-6]